MPSPRSAALLSVQRQFCLTPNRSTLYLPRTVEALPMGRSLKIIQIALAYQWGVVIMTALLNSLNLPSRCVYPEFPPAPTPTTQVGVHRSIRLG